MKPARLKARPEILDRRRKLAEHSFDSIKQWMNQDAFLTKRARRVLPHGARLHLRRALSILGVETTMPAVPRGKRLKCGPILAGTTHVGSP